MRGTLVTILMLAGLAASGAAQVVVDGQRPLATREELDDIVKQANYCSPVANTMRNPVPFSLSTL